jgi:hypothetical protein
MPLANLALAALAAVAAARLIALSGRRAALAGSALVALIAADLLVFPLERTAADPGNAAYAALRAAPAGRTLELPLVEPGVHFGSVYDYYQLQAPRERPGGYSTLVPQPPYDFYFLRNRVSCGVWLPGDEQALRALDVDHVTFHAGVYAQSETPGAWFGWRGLLAHGFRPVAQGGEITLFERGAAGADAAAPVPEPERGELQLCQGWEGRTMEERQGPLWIHGEGRLTIVVGAAAPTPASLWIDGERVDSSDVEGTATLAGELRGEDWHALVLEVPELLPTTPREGLRLDAVRLQPFGP